MVLYPVKDVDVRLVQRAFGLGVIFQYFIAQHLVVWASSIDRHMYLVVIFDYQHMALTDWSLVTSRSQID